MKLGGGRFVQRLVQVPVDDGGIDNDFGVWYTPA